MTQLSDAQIAGYAAGAGFSGHDLQVAVAVCLAESSGKTDSRGDVGLQTSTWGPSIGLMQIRSLNAEKGKGTARDEIANLDPATNMAHAHGIFVAQGWRPWTTYNTGAYLLYMGRAGTAAASPAGGAGSSGADGGIIPVDFQVGLPDPLGIRDLIKLPGGIVGALQTIAAGFVKSAHWLMNRNNMLRIGMVGSGIIIGGGALFILARPVTEPIVNQAAGLVTSAAAPEIGAAKEAGAAKVKADKAKQAAASKAAAPKSKPATKSKPEDK